MLQVLRSVLSPILSLILLMLGNGFSMTLVTLCLRLNQASNAVIGLTTAAYYAGFFIGSFRVEKFIQRIGHIRTYCTFASLLGAVSLLMGFWSEVWFWILCRFIIGVSMAGLFITIESWLLVKSTLKTRGEILSLYMISLYGSMALGQLLLELGEPNSLLPFAVIGALSCFSLLPVSLTRHGEPKMEEPSLLQLRQILKISPLGAIGSFLSGMVLASLYGLSPIFSQDIGMNLSEIAIFMGVSIFGGLLLQWPLGFLSDRSDRRIVILGASLCSAILAFFIGWLEYQYPYLLFGLAAFFGGFSFTLYPLSISHCCDALEPKDIVAATGALLIAYGMGAILGPLLAPLTMSWLGPQGLYYYFSFLALLLAATSLFRIFQKEPIPAEEKLPFTNLPRTTPLVGELDPRKEEHHEKKISS